MVLESITWFTLAGKVSSTTYVEGICYHFDLLFSFLFTILQQSFGKPVQTC